MHTRSVCLACFYMAARPGECIQVWKRCLTASNSTALCASLTFPGRTELWILCLYPYYYVEVIAENKVNVILTQTSFCQLHTDSASSGLQEHVMLYIDDTSVVKIMAKLEGCNWGVLSLSGGFGWKDHAYQSDEISTSPHFCTWGEVRLLGVGSDVFGYSRQSEGVSWTSSHMSGSWYFPFFLLRDGSLTQI